jgi:hypothetical protein
MHKPRTTDESPDGEALSLRDLSEMMNHPDVRQPIKDTWAEFQSYIDDSLVVRAFPGHVDPSHLARIYRIRTKILMRRNALARGFEDAVDALERATEPVTLISVDTERHAGLAFCTGDLKHVVAFIFNEVPEPSGLMKRITPFLAES